MAHGTLCNCMMCSLGKKIGMIKEEGTSNTCSACGHAHREDGKCDCNCG